MLCDMAEMCGMADDLDTTADKLQAVEAQVEQHDRRHQTVRQRSRSARPVRDQQPVRVAAKTWPASSPSVQHSNKCTFSSYSCTHDMVQWECSLHYEDTSYGGQWGRKEHWVRVCEPCKTYIESQDNKTLLLVTGPQPI